VCSNKKYCGRDHWQFVHDFIKELFRLSTTHDLTELGNYQVRYNMYQELAPSYQEGLNQSPVQRFFEERTSFEDCETPVNYTCKNENITASCYHAHNCWKSENLKACSNCKVVRYCCRECQTADWPKHKKYCKEMAKLRKDKEAVAARAKNT
jgi:MYND finger